MNRRLHLVMALVALAVAAWTAPGAWARASYGARATADEPQYLMTALSIAEDGSLDVSDERREGRYRDFHEVGLPQQEKVNEDGSRISPHDPALPGLLALPMAVGGWLAAKLTIAVLAGLLAAAMIWIAVRRFGVSLRLAVVATLAFSAAAPLGVYGTQIYPELPAALLVALAIGALTGPLGARGLSLLSAVVVALPWFSVKYVPVAGALAVLGAIRLWRADERRRTLAFGGVLALGGVIFLAAHQLMYGGWTPYAAGSHFVGGELTVAGEDPDYVGRAVRLVGLLVDRNFGLAIWQPAFLLAVPAIAALWRRRPDGWLVLAVPLAVGWLNATFVALTMHGWWWPGRQVVVVLPCIVIAIAWWASTHVFARRLLVVGLALGALTFAWLLIDVLSGHMTLIVDFDRTTNPLVRAWRTLMPDGRLRPTGTTALTTIWAAVVVGLAWLGARAARVRTPALSAPTAEAPVLVRS
jgi:hypothetical protein